MNTKLLPFAAIFPGHLARLIAGRFALLILCAVSVNAAPLTETTAVHTKPDRTSPAITFLKAGTEPVASTDPAANAPAGWIAIDLPGPFEAYVENKDLTKGLDVTPGAPMRLAPKPDAGVLAVAEKGDKTTISGLLGKWTQISLEKKLVGYVSMAGPAPTMPASTPTPMTAAPAPTTSSSSGTAPLAPAPVAPAAYGTAAPGQPAPMVNLGNSNGSSLPRQFAGKFVTTRRAFTPRRPYDWALNDNAGKRYAFLDVSKLLLTEQIEKYADHQVEVFGAAKATPDGKDMVIVVESLQLK